MKRRKVQMDKIYIQIGRVRKSDTIYKDEGGEKEVIEDYSWNEVKKPYDRKVVRVKLLYGLNRNEEVLLAEYYEYELEKSDLAIIKKHTMTTNAELSTGEKIAYRSFTHNHFLETLKNRKMKMCKKKGIEFDGTIFGEAKTTIKVPEQIIPAHDKEIFVQWDDWNDCYEDETKYERC